jgi:2-phosphoglycerate kinase
MNRWPHVYWLGGAPCAGKSSAAGLLTQTYPDLRVYAVDAHLPVDKLTSERQPALYKWTHTPWEELWSQPPAPLLAETITAYREHFALVLEEVGSLAADPQPLLVEGTCLLPECVAGLDVPSGQTLWVIPAPDFLRAHYPHRGAWVQSILSQCHDPARALANWLDRDTSFAAWVAAETAARGQPLITVDGRRAIADLADQIAVHFQHFIPSLR